MQVANSQRDPRSSPLWWFLKRSTCGPPISRGSLRFCEMGSKRHRRQKGPIEQAKWQIRVCKSQLLEALKGEVHIANLLSDPTISGEERVRKELALKAGVLCILTLRLEDDLEKQRLKVERRAAIVFEEQPSYRGHRGWRAFKTTKPR